MKKNLVIVGGGAAALFLANAIDPDKYDVSIYEKNKALARKFLVAGDGGLNLTHSESPEKFIERYTPSNFIRPAFTNFSNLDFIAWLNEIGISTYKGTSGRIFPEKGLKPVQVLEVLIKRMQSRGVQIFSSHKCLSINENDTLIFEHEKKQKEVKADLIVFCLGGASWSVTGSDGKWTALFSKLNLKINPFQASNCSFNVKWPEQLESKIEGKPLKNIQILCEGVLQLGEVVLTRSGIEGSGIYPFSPLIRKQLSGKKSAKVSIDFKPLLSEEQIKKKLSDTKSKLSLSQKLTQSLNCSATMLHLLKSYLSKEEFTDLDQLTASIKNFPLTITGLGPLEDAISSVGGISLDEINEHFELKKKPNWYAIGEMLDYDAPTGGYLLQSCFTMGMALANGLNKKSKINFISE